MTVSNNSTKTTMIRIVRRWFAPGRVRAFHYPKEAQAAGLRRSAERIRPLI